MAATKEATPAAMARRMNIRPTTGEGRTASRLIETKQQKHRPVPVLSISGAAAEILDRDEEIASDNSEKSACRAT
jgi:hypothetical protein